MKKVKTFEAFLLECGKDCKPEMKKEKCPKCGKGKKCKCDKEEKE